MAVLLQLLPAAQLSVAGSAAYLAVTDTITAALIAAIASVVNTGLLVWSRREQRRHNRAQARTLKRAVDELDQEDP